MGPPHFLKAGSGSGSTSSGKLDSDPHHVKGRFRICMKKKSRLRTPHVSEKRDQDQQKSDADPQHC
jgi:hypothetical protein